jgi:hypothetical protein
VLVGGTTSRCLLGGTTSRCLFPGAGGGPVPQASGRGEPMAVENQIATTSVKMDSTDSTAAKTVELRHYFPETWLWEIEVIG